MNRLCPALYTAIVIIIGIQYSVYGQNENDSIRYLELKHVLQANSLDTAVINRYITGAEKLIEFGLFGEALELLQECRKQISSGQSYTAAEDTLFTPGFAKDAAKPQDKKNVTWDIALTSSYTHFSFSDTLDTLLVGVSADSVDTITRLQELSESFRIGLLWHRPGGHFRSLRPFIECTPQYSFADSLTVNCRAGAENRLLFADDRLECIWGVDAKAYVNEAYRDSMNSFNGRLGLLFKSGRGPFSYRINSRAEVIRYRFARTLSVDCDRYSVSPSFSYELKDKTVSIDVAFSGGFWNAYPTMQKKLIDTSATDTTENDKWYGDGGVVVSWWSGFIDACANVTARYEFYPGAEHRLDGVYPRRTVGCDLELPVTLAPDIPLRFETTPRYEFQREDYPRSQVFLSSDGMSLDTLPFSYDIHFLTVKEDISVELRTSATLNALFEYRLQKILMSPREFTFALKEQCFWEEYQSYGPGLGFSLQTARLILQAQTSYRYQNYGNELDRYSFEPGLFGSLALSSRCSFSLSGDLCYTNYIHSSLSDLSLFIYFSTEVHF